MPRPIRFRARQDSEEQLRERIAYHSKERDRHEKEIGRLRALVAQLRINGQSQADA